LNSNGESFYISDIKVDADCLILVFFSMNNHRSIDNLSEIYDVYHEELSDSNIKMIAINTDKEGNLGEINSKLQGQNIITDVYFDNNGELFKTLGLLTSTSVLLFDGNMVEYCRQCYYCPSNCNLIGEEITKCLQKSDTIAGNYNPSPE